MADDTLTFHDYEFLFKNVDTPLNVFLVDGRDDIYEDALKIVFTVHPQPDQTMTITIYRDDLRAFQLTTRTEPKERTMDDVITDAFSAHQDV